MPAIRGFVIVLAASAAVFTLGPRVLGQAAPADPAAQFQLATEHFDAARYREAMDAYDAAIRGNDAALALRISNLIAIAMLFALGYSFGRCAERHPWLSGILMVVLGAVLVGITMALGG